MINTRNILYSGFFAVLLLMVIYASIALSVLNNSMHRFDTVVNNNNAKSELLNSMRTYARERNIILNRMLSNISDEEVELLWAEMGRYGGEFSAARETLLGMSLSAQERAFLDQQRAQSMIIAPLQHQIAELVVFNERDKARKILFEQALPRQDRVFEVLSDLLTIQKQNAAMALEDATSDYHRAMINMAVVAVFILFVSINIVVFVIRRITHSEETLRFHRDNLDVLVKERTAELEGALKLAEQANIAKSEFVSTVSHELRTPLTSIKASIGLIYGGVVGELPVKMKNMLEIAESNTERLIFLINDLLDIQKIEAGLMHFSFKYVDIGELIKRAVNNAQAYAEQRHVSICCSHMPEGEIIIYADSNRILQVIDNLLSNAIKFSPAGSEVELGLEIQAESVKLSVIDHGAGIPEKFQSQVFDKFTQADASDTRTYGGTGLGMNISKAIIDQHGGQIGFTTEQAVGTTFYIEIPRFKSSS